MPILVGSISSDVEAIYGEILAPYLADSQNLFVISSDFCHWGKRFSYTYFDESCGHIHKSIEKLDKNVRDTNNRNSIQYFHEFFFLFQGMDIIETLNPAAFSEYLKRYNNTICGRHPIGVMLQVTNENSQNSNSISILLHFFFQAVKLLQSRGYRQSFKFLKYAQSSQCFNMADSSVSYASGSLIFE